MAYASFEYTADGATTTWVVPFPFLDPTTIYVYLNDVRQVNGVGYTYNGTSNSIVFGTAPAASVIVKIQRASNLSSPYITFDSGTVLTADVLNKSATQNRYALQELYDSTGTLEEVVSGDLIANNNLSDVNSASISRTNLGLGSMAIQNSNAVDIRGGTIINAIISNSNIAATNLTGSSVSSTTVSNSTITGGTATSEAISSSTIVNSTVSSSTIDSSSISNSTLSGATISGSTIQTTTISNSTINNDVVGHATSDLAIANNLLELKPTNSTARSNLGCGTLATWTVADLLAWLKATYPSYFY